MTWAMASSSGVGRLLMTWSSPVASLNWMCSSSPALRDGEERGVGLEVVVVELPDEAGLRGVAHPGDDGGGRVEELRVAALVHGAVGLVVRELRFADEVGEVARSCRSGLAS